jgi:hypothetical protein
MDDFVYLNMIDEAVSVFRDRAKQVSEVEL